MVGDRLLRIWVQGVEPDSCGACRFIHEAFGHCVAFDIEGDANQAEHMAPNRFGDSTPRLQACLDSEIAQVERSKKANAFDALETALQSALLRGDSVVSSEQALQTFIGETLDVLDMHEASYQSAANGYECPSCGACAESVVLLKHADDCAWLSVVTRLRGIAPGWPAEGRR